MGGVMAHSTTQGTQVLIRKPTIIDGVWRDVPTVVRIVRGRIVEEWLPQVREAGLHLAVLVVIFPPLFMLADWLRYGGA